MATNEINIAFAADENYVQPMSVAITSILKRFLVNYDYNMLKWEKSKFLKK